MQKLLISDFSQVLLFPKTISYSGSLNKLYNQVVAEKQNFEDFYILNEPLLTELQKLEVEKVIFTTGTVQNAPEIRSKVQAVFKKIFTVPMIGIQKTNSEAYTRICEELNTDPANALFIDDTQANVSAAQQAGLEAVVYENNAQILSAIESWIRNDT